MKPWVDLSHQLGGPIDEQAKMVLAQFTTLRQILLVATKCQKPDQTSFIELLQPLQKDTEAVVGIKDQNRSSKDWFNHLATVAEGASCVGWVTLVRIHNLIKSYLSALSGIQTSAICGGKQELGSVLF